uniref:RING finger protein nhl-1-like n=1 Tax=Phallusia mammillata TaxID=59560 RepID=A0A6F9DWJ5_9ASCI|nr:RING finger protein nhl-1-like [Phallusia mammillata]
MVAILELPKNKSPQLKEACQECLQENCTPKKCSHCEKKLCSSCTQVHLQQLVQSLSRSINQLKRLLPKLADMISDLEEKQLKSSTLASSVKEDVDQAIDHCMAKLKARQQNLHDQIDSFVATEIHQLRIEQENMEMEMAMVNSHCDTAEKKCKLFTESENPEVLSPSETSLLTQQSNEHLRNLKLISSNIEDKIAHNVKFRNEGERSLLSAVGSFGEITVNIPSRLSFSLGSDPEINDVEIHRAMQQGPHGRRRTEIMESYVPSFSLSPSDTVIPGYSPSPSNSSYSPHESLVDTNNSQRNMTNLPVPGASSHPTRMPRPRRTSYRLQAPELTRLGGGDPVQAGDSPSSVQYASVRGTLWQYRSKGPVKSWFGQKGSDIGCLNWPRGVAASLNDRIAVADSSNHRIHLYESSGEPALTFGGYGTDEGQFDCVSGVHVTAQGWVITTDRYNHRVQIFDSMGRFIRMFGQEGTGEGELSYPWGVATDNMGFVYVCDKDNHRIQVV